MEPPVDTVTITWTRTQLVAVREAIELTPMFSGRAEVRDAVRASLRSGGKTPVALGREAAARLASRIVATDPVTRTALVRLREAARSGAAA